MRKKILTLSKILVSIALLGYLVVTIDITSVIRVISSTNPGYLAIAFLLILSGVVLSALKWKLLLGAIGVHISLLLAVKYYFIGLYFNNFMPTSIGGDVVRIHETAKASGHKTEVALSVLTERILGLLALMIIGLLGLFYFVETKTVGQEIIQRAVVILGLIIAIILVIVIGGLDIGNRVLAGPAATRKYKATETIVQTGVEALNAFKKNKGVLFITLSFSIIFQSMVIGGNYFAALSAGLSLDIKWFVMFIPAVTIISMVPITLNGIGLRENSYVYFFGIAGLTSEAALSIGIITYLLVLAASLIGGLTYLIEAVFGHKHSVKEMMEPHTENGNEQ